MYLVGGGVQLVAQVVECLRLEIEWLLVLDSSEALHCVLEQGSLISSA